MLINELELFQIEIQIIEASHNKAWPMLENVYLSFICKTRWHMAPDAVLVTLI